jgi:hypothetical protein
MAGVQKRKINMLRVFPLSYQIAKLAEGKQKRRWAASRIN